MGVDGTTIAVGVGCTIVAVGGGVAGVGVGSSAGSDVVGVGIGPCAGAGVAVGGGTASGGGASVGSGVIAPDGPVGSMFVKGVVVGTGASCEGRGVGAGVEVGTPAGVTTGVGLAAGDVTVAPANVSPTTTGDDGAPVDDVMHATVAKTIASNTGMNFDGRTSPPIDHHPRALPNAASVIAAVGCIGDGCKGAMRALPYRLNRRSGHDSDHTYVQCEARKGTGSH